MFVKGRNVCRECINKLWSEAEKNRKKNSAYRKKLKEYRHSHYERTKEYQYALFLKRYRSFNGYKYQLYKNRKSLGRKFKRELTFTLEEFLNFLKKENKKYTSLWKKWVESNYQKKFAPSIDRIDNKKGYTLQNIQLLSVGENVRKARLNDGVNNPRNKTNGQYTGVANKDLLEAHKKFL